MIATWAKTPHLWWLYKFNPSYEFAHKQWMILPAWSNWDKYIGRPLAARYGLRKLCKIGTTSLSFDCCAIVTWFPCRVQGFCECKSTISRGQVKGPRWLRLPLQDYDNHYETTLASGAEQTGQGIIPVLRVIKHRLSSASIYADQLDEAKGHVISSPFKGLILSRNMFKGLTPSRNMTRGNAAGRMNWHAGAVLHRLASIGRNRGQAVMLEVFLIVIASSMKGKRRDSLLLVSSGTRILSWLENFGWRRWTNWVCSASVSPLSTLTFLSLSTCRKKMLATWHPSLWCKTQLISDADHLDIDFLPMSSFLTKQT